MKGIIIQILFVMAMLAMFIAGKLGWGRRTALSFCLLAVSLGCGAAYPEGEKSDLIKKAGAKDPLQVGKAWQDFAAEATKVDQLTSGKFDNAIYERTSDEYYKIAQALKDAVAGRSQAEANAVSLLADMYSSMLFDWFAMNSMITCYSPVIPPTKPLDIAGGQLNSRIIDLHNQFVQGKLNREAYNNALQSMVPEAAGDLDQKTQDNLKLLLADLNTK